MFGILSKIMPVFQNPWALALAVAAPFLARLTSRIRRPTDRKGARDLTILRTLILILLAAALAGPVIPDRRTPAVAIMYDASASCDGGEFRNFSIIRNRLVRESPDARVSVSAFGATAETIIPPIPARQLPADISRPPLDDRETRLDRALQTGADIAGPGGTLVLISDGNDTSGRASGEIPILQSRGIRVLTAPVVRRVNDAAVTTLEGPGRASPGASVAFRAVVETSTPGERDILFRRDGQILAREHKTLDPDIPLVMSFRDTYPADALPGHRYEVALDLPDASPRNDRASRVVLLAGNRRILVFQPHAGGAFPIPTPPNATVELRLPGKAGEVTPADLIILSNIPASALAPETQRRIQRAVRDEGTGLLVLGGPDSLGPGGYAGTPLSEILPVRLDPRDTAERSLAIVLALDVSGSMGEGSPTKISGLKSAVFRLLDRIRGGEALGLVTFNQEPRVAFPLQAVTDASALRGIVSVLDASGRTNLTKALAAAHEVLRNSPAKRRHVLFLSDGGFGAREDNDGSTLAACVKMASSGISISVVATGGEQTDRGTLERIATLGRGRFHDVADARLLADVFEKDIETERHGALIREEPHACRPALPIPWMPATLPDIRGYVRTALRGEAAALTAASVDNGDPLLVLGRHGLGHVAVFTSSLDRDWANAWKTPPMHGFWTGLEQSLMPPSEKGFTLSAGESAGGIAVMVEARRDGKPLLNRSFALRVVNPGGTASTLPMNQTAPGRYAASVPAPSAGDYALAILDTAAGAGDPLIREIVTIACPAEWKRLKPDMGLLRRLAELTGGRVMADVASLSAADIAPGAGRPRPLHLPFLIAAAILVLIEMIYRWRKGLL
ncbi:MAG: VWA domain-containing protein [Planctomycetota bacterium]